MVFAELSLVVAAFVGFVLPFLTLDPQSLTTRPYFWDLARQHLSTSPLYGLGAKAWEGLYQDGQIPVALSHSLQNQWIDVMFMGGIIALAVFVLLLGYIVLRGGASNFLVATCLIVPVLAASTLERPWSFSINDSLTFTLVAATLIPVIRTRGSSACSSIRRIRRTSGSQALAGELNAGAWGPARWSRHRAGLRRST